MKNGKAKSNLKSSSRKPTSGTKKRVNGASWDPKMYDRGLRAFERDLPELMKTHHRQWVVYHGERRIGPFKKLERLDQVCKDLDIPMGERVYRVVEPDMIEDTVAL